mmetsp:Transcript_13330/g.47373  ORF Transcript_13330/g.47373 Transcript_13330/m.47373 type:complete len:103 (-) Transcript_13330:119-427(-)
MASPRNRGTALPPRLKKLGLTRKQRQLKIHGPPRSASASIDRSRSSSTAVAATERSSPRAGALGDVDRNADDVEHAAVSRIGAAADDSDRIFDCRDLLETLS